MEPHSVQAYTGVPQEQVMALTPSMSKHVHSEAPHSNIV